MSSLSREAAAAQVAAWKAAGQRVVFTNGCFDLLHAGHVRYLQAARDLGERLVLGLNSDASVRRLKGPERPLVGEGDRAELMAALRCVDAVVIFDEPTAVETVQALKPSIYAKGGDYSPANLPEAAAVAEVGGELAFLPFVEGRSTTGIVERIKNLARQEQ